MRKEKYYFLVSSLYIRLLMFVIISFFVLKISSNKYYKLIEYIFSIIIFFTYAFLFFSLVKITYDAQVKMGTESALIDLFKIKLYLKQADFYSIVLIYCFLAFALSFIIYYIFYALPKNRKHSSKTFGYYMLFGAMILGLLLLLIFTTPSQFSSIIGLISIVALFNQIRMSTN